MSCSHPDIREFDGVRCCLACGEAVFEPTASSPTANIKEIERKYHYFDLNLTLGQQIRLLVVQPGEHPDPILCEILHVNLDDVPEYEAISYTWGDVCKPRRIQCLDGSTIDVTVNCEAALRQVRKPGLKRWLWIDSICINQDCIKERNHQVGLMHQIYSRATRVLICIHDPDLSYCDLFQWLKNDCDNMHDKSALIAGKMARLLSLRYFCRLWVIQEVALARAAFLHVNTDSVLLSDKVLQRLWDLCASYNIEIPGILRLVPGDRREYDLLGWLAATVRCKSTDLKDKVYAIVGLLDPDTRSNIPIDYSLEFHQVYANALTAIIRSRRDLGVLSYVSLADVGISRVTEEVLSYERLYDYILQTASAEGVSVSFRDMSIDVARTRPLIQFERI